MLTARRTGDGLAICFLGSHPEHGEQRLAPVRTRKADEPCVDPRWRPGSLERPREDIVEVDRRADLPELACAPRLGARLVECGCELAVQVICAREGFAQELLDGGVGGPPPAHDYEQDDERRDQREARRAGCETDGNSCCAGAQKHMHPSRSPWPRRHGHGDNNP